MSKIKCVKLIGDLESWGKHILTETGITLCGQPTVDVSLAQYPQLKHPKMQGMINQYTDEDWDITCEKCLEMIEIIQAHKKYKSILN